MELNRRSFLKGLAALAGVATVGLPTLDAGEAITEAEQIVATHDVIRPRGAFGSLRVGDRWYALHWASLDVQQQFIEIDFGTPWQTLAPGMRSWEFTCALDGDSGLNPFDASKMEIEFDLRGGRDAFIGDAVIASIAPSIAVDGSTEQVLTFMGIGDLKHVL